MSLTLARARVIAPPATTAAIKPFLFHATRAADIVADVLGGRIGFQVSAMRKAHCLPDPRPLRSLLEPKWLFLNLLSKIRNKSVPVVL